MHHLHLMRLPGHYQVDGLSHKIDSTEKGRMEEGAA